MASIVLNRVTFPQPHDALIESQLYPIRAILAVPICAPLWPASDAKGHHVADLKPQNCEIRRRLAGAIAQRLRRNSRSAAGFGTCLSPEGIAKGFILAIPGERLSRASERFLFRLEGQGPEDRASSDLLRAMLALDALRRDSGFQPALIALSSVLLFDSGAKRNQALTPAGVMGAWSLVTRMFAPGAVPGMTARYSEH
jgi:hypothetical protein